MIEKVFSFFKTLVNLVERSETQKKRLIELQKEVEQLTQIILVQQEQIRRVEAVGEERDKRILLEVENMLLKFERRLPPDSK